MCRWSAFKQYESDISYPNLRDGWKSCVSNSRYLLSFLISAIRSFAGSGDSYPSNSARGSSATLERLPPEESNIDDAWLALTEGVYRTGSGSLISSDDVLKRGRYDGLSGEESPVAVWKDASVLAELAALIASGDLEVPIAATFPLDQVRAAFSLLGQGHIRGKIVLLP